MAAQSTPVSPPPTITTSLPLTFIKSVPLSKSLVTSAKKSLAWKICLLSTCTPGKTLGFLLPTHKTTAAKSSCSLEKSSGLFSSQLNSNFTPCALRSVIFSISKSFGSLMLGTPYIKRPPGLSSRSKTVTS